MTPEPLDTSDTLIQRERRGIMGALCIIVLLSAAAIARWAEWELPWPTLGIIMAAIVIPFVTISSLSPSLRGYRSIAAKRHVIRIDETRRVAMDRACRYAFVTLLALLCAGMVCTALWPSYASATVILASSVVLGATVFLVAFLLLDRST